MRCSSCGRESPADASFCSGCGSRLEAPPPAAAPSSVLQGAIASGRYTLGELLGEGASKRVYLGRDSRLDREVAVARIDTAGLDDAGRLRIEREAQAMARLGDHPNIVTVHDVLEEDGAIYIVSQYLAGGDLGRRIAAAPGGRLTVDDAVATGIELCRALEHAHGRGVIHRDVKPRNVWLTDGGTAKLGDFGLAIAVDRSRLTAEGVIVGTVPYMPPEQALGQPRDARSDLYALGATLYEMVTGRPPFVGDDAIAVLSQHLHAAPVAPSWHNEAVPPALDRLIVGLLAKDPESRPASAAAVRGELQAMKAEAASDADARAAAVAVNPLDRLAGGIFVGRAAEVERLRAALDDALAGRSRVVLLSGEPGIGKTRTAEELGTYAGMRGAQVLWGRCHEGQGAPPFWPWVQVVRAWLEGREPREVIADLGAGASDLAAIVPELHQTLPGLPPPSSLEPEQARFRLFESLTVLLRNLSRRRPTLVVLDDLHWADEASLRLLEFLARELGPARLLLVATYRDVELRRGHRLADTLGELARERSADRLVLRGLSRDEVERYLTQTAGKAPAAGLADTVHRETEGNPFFVQEVVRLLVAEGSLDRAPEGGSWGHAIPQGVREVVGRRLSRLAPEANEVLAAASVLGRDFELRPLARLVGRDELAVLEALDEAIAARLLLEERQALGHYRFAHALVRDTLYDELGGPRRVRLHRAAGEALERAAVDAAGPVLIEIAHHYFQAAQAGDLERTLGACERAAAWAASQQAWEDSALYLDRAVQVLEMGDRPDPRRLCELLVELAERQSLGRDTERTRATALRAAELARGLGDGRLLARAALAYGAHFSVIEAGRVDSAMTGLLEEALGALGEGDHEPALRAAVLVRLSQELLFSSESDRRIALFSEARRVAALSGDPALVARVEIGTGYGLDRLHHEPVEESDRLVELGRQSGDAAVEERAWEAVAAIALWRGDVDRFRRAHSEVARLADELRTPLVRYQSLRMAATLATLEGRFEEAFAQLRAARDVVGGAAGGSTLQQWYGSVAYVIGRHRGVAMPPERTLALIGRFLDNQPVFRALLCGVYLSNGDRNDARRELGLLAVDDFAPIRGFNGWQEVLTLIADHVFELEETRYAGTVYSLLLPIAGRCPGIGPMVVCLGPVDLRLGRLAALLGRDDDALAHLNAAVELAVDMGARPDEAEARQALAEVLARGGERERALAETRAALAVGRELGMAPVVERALALELSLEGGPTPGGDERTLPVDRPSSP